MLENGWLAERLDFLRLAPQARNFFFDMALLIRKIAEKCTSSCVNAERPTAIELLAETFETFG